MILMFSFRFSPDLHTQQTTNNLAALLVAPIKSYTSVLTLLALENYVPLLNLQTFATRRSLAHSIVSSVLKNETIIEAQEDVNGILELCQVLIREQPDAGVGMGSTGPPSLRDGRRHGPYGMEREDLAEEQGWLARMVHLFKSESLATQFEVRATVYAFLRPYLIRTTVSFCKQHGDISKLEENGCVSHIQHLSPLPSNSADGTSSENTWSVRFPFS